MITSLSHDFFFLYIFSGIKIMYYIAICFPFVPIIEILAKDITMVHFVPFSANRTWSFMLPISCRVIQMNCQVIFPGEKLEKYNILPVC